MPRPAKLTPEIREQICADIRKGLPRERAALGAGISEATFYRWMEKGDPDAQGEPNLAAMTTKTLREVAKSAQITIPHRATRRQILTILDEAGQGSWAAYREFREAVNRADLELEGRLTDEIQKASAPRFDDDGKLLDPGKPQVLLTFLARRFPHWSPTHQVEVSGPEGQPIPIEVRAKQIAESAAAFRASEETDHES